MVHRILCVGVVLLLTVVKLGFSWTEVYVPIEVSSSIVIVDEKGDLIKDSDPLGRNHVILKQGKKYFVKVQLINNGEGKKMGYPSDTYKGKIRFELRYGHGPDDSYYCDPVVFAIYDNQVFKPMEVKEYIVPISLDMFKVLSDKNYYYVTISYWDYEWEKKQRKEGREQEKYIGWMGTGQYDIYQGNEKREKTVNYGADSYLIYLSEEAVKERFKYYDKEKKRFIKPKDGSFYRNSNDTNPFPLFTTTDTRWAYDYMVNNSVTIGGNSNGKGCIMVCAAMIIKATGRGVNPRLLNHWMRENKKYLSTGAFNGFGGTPFEYVSGVPIPGNGLGGNNGIFDTVRQYDKLLSELGNDINNNRVAFIRVNLSKDERDQHFVLLYHCKNPGSTNLKDYLIHDPTWPTAKLSLEDYKDVYPQYWLGTNSKGETIIKETRYFRAINGYRYIRKQNEWDFYTYAPVSNEQSIKIIPARTDHNTYITKTGANAKNNDSFEYGGGEQLFTTKAENYLVAQMIQNSDNPDADQNYCYTRWYFKVTNDGIYAFTADIPNIDDISGEFRYKLYKRNNPAGLFPGTPSKVGVLTNSPDHNRIIKFDDAEIVSLSPGDYVLELSNTTDETSQVGKNIVFGGIEIKGEKKKDLFIQHTQLSNHFWQSSSEFADIDNDGLLDLVIMGKTEQGQKLCIYYGERADNGNVSLSTIASEITYSTPLSTPNADFKIGDMNNDGFLDIVIVGSNGVMVILTSSDGNLILKDSQDHDIDLSLSVASVALGDLDNDGDLDIVAMGRVSGDDYVLCWYENTINTRTTCVDADSIGKFEHHGVGPYGRQKGAMGSVLLRDYNGDGILDMLITGRTDGIYDDGASFTPPKVVFEVLRGSITNGEVTYTVIPIPTESNQFYVFTHNGGMDWADADGDGDMDILLMGKKGSNGFLQVYTNKGQGNDGRDNFEADTQLNAVFASYQLQNGTCAWGDLNNDGLLDIVV